MRLMVTGGAGFIGSHFTRDMLRSHPDWTITVLDKLTYAGNLANLEQCAESPNFTFVQGDIADSESVQQMFEHKRFDAVVNFAAESHVDRSILDSAPFVRSNIEGTRLLLDAVRVFKVERFVQVSTDEVYGSLEAGSYDEEAPLAPSSPYAASKAAADLLCMSYGRTHGVPYVIARSSNNYGPNQYHEKLIPMVIRNLLRGATVPIYGDGTNIRRWLYVGDGVRAIDLVLRKGRTGEVYNIGGRDELRNIDLVKKLIQEVGTHLPGLRHTHQFVPDRPGHDYRYSMDSSKAAVELGWVPTIEFAEGLARTVAWYLSEVDGGLLASSLDDPNSHRSSVPGRKGVRS